MIRYLEFDVASAKDHIKPLLEAHWKEVAMYQDKIDLDPDYDRYLEAGEKGMIMCAVVLDGEKAIGYSVYFLNYHPHYKQTIWANNDILYLDPEYRNLGVGDDLLKYSEQRLKLRGVEVITLHMKTSSPFDGLCDRLGYANIEKVYAKYLGD